MDRISRRQVVQRAAAAAGTAMTLGAPSVQAQKNQQTLGFVAEADLKIFDPVWTTAYITRNHSFLVYDTLFGTDENLQIKPQMVDQVTVSPDGMKYTLTLRDGLRWHDGQPVLSEDCVESVAGQPAVGHDVRFFSFDLTNTCWIRSFYCSRGSILVMWEANDLELEQNEPVLKAITASLRVEED